MAGAPPVDEHPDRPVWRNREFLLLWLAQAISQTAQNAIWYGVVVLVQRKSNSSTQLSLAVLTLILPSVIFGVLAGVFVDRRDKRAVLIVTNILRGAVAFAYVLFAEGDWLPFALLFVVNFVFSTIGQFFAPAEAAMIPVVVGMRRLLQANGLFHLTFTASQLIGLVLLGPLLAKLVGLSWLFASMAAAIVLCGFVIWPIRPHRGAALEKVPSSGRAAIRGVIADVQVVARFVLRDRVIALAMIQWTIGGILGLVVATLVPGFAERLLYVRAEDAVFIMAPAGIGMVAGTALLNRWGDRFDKHFLANVGLSVIALTLSTIGVASIFLDRVTDNQPPLTPMPWLGDVSVLVPPIMLLALLAGLGFVSVIVPTQTYLQERAPDTLRGRVFAVQLMLSNLASIVPLLVLGGLADLIGVDRTFVLVGLLIGVAAAISYRIAPGRPPALIARRT